MKHTDQEGLVKYIEILIDLSQWACSEGWEEIEKTTDELIRAINKEQNR